LDLPVESFEHTMKVNALSHVLILKRLLPTMIKKNQGHIVTIASTMGLIPAAGLVDYNGSKFAAVGYHHAIRLGTLNFVLTMKELFRLGKTGVKTTLVCPNYIKTGTYIWKY
jgi:all-trans-retinol dehydrogenase (NAD+)